MRLVRLGCVRKVGETDAESVGQTQNVRETGVPFAPFNSGDIRAIELGLVGKSLLRESGVTSELT